MVIQHTDCAVIVRVSVILDSIPAAAKVHALNDVAHFLILLFQLLEFLQSLFTLLDSVRGPFGFAPYHLPYRTFSAICIQINFGCIHITPNAFLATLKHWQPSLLPNSASSCRASR